MNSTASTAENEARRAASLRRIAIVLQDLPQAVAKRLLADLSPDARQRVRQELASLVDVDPMERRRALESFTGSMRRGAARQTDQGNLNTTDEVTFSHAAHSAPVNRPHAAGMSSPANPSSAHSPSPSQAPESSSPDSLAFLSQVGDDDLLNLLKDEHPQTKAVVLAQIEPARAAALLPRLGGAQRQDLLTRIGRLHTLPEEMLSELADSFRSRVDRILESKTANPLQSLIDAYGGGQPADPATAAAHVPASAAAVSPRLQAILAEMPASANAAQPQTNSPSSHQPVRSAVSGHDAASIENEKTAAERLRRITREEPVASDNDRQPNAASRAESASLGMSTDDVHRELVKLPARKLCEALGRVDTRTAILALCGLPNKTADAAIACLPRAQANQVRQRLLSVGSLEIRDIDRAKEAVAGALRIGGQISTPSSTPNAAPSQRVAVAM
ncbi:FliG C-terminal domain-containing protein [Rhodopirellula sallentina]|uniref:Flagellar motor switch protein FliG n=1 Tax=Rhodopirellula sallentina SM41 TaxID=1263870 RepID=M5UHS9_9BACT|nr:FliG C-terminal domain-containing protein [Rhodopirellula sallentina]EMI57401.1 flagellar motor switch protein FliG [Rhodopirellula sallentina SM41]